MLAQFLPPEKRWYLQNVARYGNERGMSRLSMSNRRIMYSLMSLILLCLESGCQRSSVTHQDKARLLLLEKGCVSCHQHSAIRRARGQVGPPLDHFDKHSYIAGTVPNTHANLTKWLLSPTHFHARSAMPDVALSEAEAQIISAYLLGRPFSQKSS